MWSPLSIPNSQFLDSILDRFRQAAAALPDSRTGSNKRYAVADAAACALSIFFFQCPSFLDFQRRMQQQSGRSNCHSLFGVEQIPSDNQIRNLLDGLDPGLFADLFPLCLDTLREHGGLDPFLRLDARLLIALDGVQIHCSDKVHCPQCSTRHVGQHKTPKYFHTMLSASIVADGHNRVLPLMPQFVQPQQDPAAKQPELPAEERKQDCERNAAKRWLPAHLPPCGPTDRSFWATTWTAASPSANSSLTSRRTSCSSVSPAATRRYTSSSPSAAARERGIRPFHDRLEAGDQLKGP